MKTIDFFLIITAFAFIGAVMLYPDNQSVKSDLQECIDATGGDLDCEYCEIVTTDAPRRIKAITWEGDSLVTVQYIELVDSSYTKEFELDYLTPNQFGLLLQHSTNF